MSKFKHQSKFTFGQLCPFVKQLLLFTIKRIISSFVEDKVLENRKKNSDIIQDGGFPMCIPRIP
jgi:hypothetical protein